VYPAARAAAVGETEQRARAPAEAAGGLVD
jgi:hypothetical protein